MYLLKPLKLKIFKIKNKMLKSLRKRNFNFYTTKDYNPGFDARIA